MNFWKIMINVILIMACFWMITDIFDEKDLSNRVTQYMVAFLFVRALAQRDGYSDIRGEA